MTSLELREYALCLALSWFMQNNLLLLCFPLEELYALLFEYFSSDTNFVFVLML